MEELDEFDYSHWESNLRTLVEQLEAVPYLYYFPTFSLGDEIALHPKVIELGLGVRDFVAAYQAGDERLEGLALATMVRGVNGRGNTVEFRVNA